MTQTLLEIKNLKKTFPVKKNFWGRTVSSLKAVDGVSLTVKKGEILGLVGESGCGKSTLGRTILKLIEADEGEILFEGQDITSLSNSQMRPFRKKIQIIFQDPYSSLNPRMTVGAILTEALALHKIVAKKDYRKRVYELLELVGLSSESYGKYPHEFSGGQRQRVGIARALSLEPELIIADEPISALDVSIQAQIINLLSDLQSKFNLSMIFIAHDLKVVEHISDRIAVMYLGKVMEVFDANKIDEVKHPYTLSLLEAVPIPDPSQRKKKKILQGDLPSPIDPPSGCVFRTRCPLAEEICSQEIPSLRQLSENHLGACHLV